MGLKKKDARLHVRLNKEDKFLLDVLSAQCGKSSAEYVDMLIQSAVAPLRLKVLKGEITYEDLQTILDNQLQFRCFFGK